MSVQDNVSNYHFWMNRSTNYSIISVLEFCGSRRFIYEASLALPQFDLVRPEYSNSAAVEAAFVKYFDTLPQQYKSAITKNNNLGTDFYDLLLDKINWYIFVENYGVDISVFRNNFDKMDVAVCANSAIRKDVFDLFDIAAVNGRLNVIQKLRSPQFAEEDLVKLSANCRTTDEKNTFVDRIIFRRYVSILPTWTPRSIFWYNYFVYNRSLCSLFCDSSEFITANEKLLDWDRACMNPHVDPQMISRNPINKSNIMRSRPAVSFLRFFNQSDTKTTLFDWYVRDETAAKNPYLGNINIFNPSEFANIPKIQPPEPEKPIEMLDVPTDDLQPLSPGAATDDDE